MLYAKYDDYKKEFNNSPNAIIVERDFNFITYDTLKRLECEEEIRCLVWKIWENRSHENDMDFKPNTTQFFSYHTIHKTTREDHSNINKLIIEDFILSILNRVIYEKKVDNFYLIGNIKIPIHSFDGIINLSKEHVKSKKLYIVPIAVNVNELESYGINIDFYINFI